MPKQTILLGDTILHASKGPATGKFVTIEGEDYYQIANYDNMRPFFMSIVSDSDHWMFISSNGALSAGRKNPDHALFPYYTDDKIHDSAEITGSKTILLANAGEHLYLWEPFSDRFLGIYTIHRNMYKSVYGNKIRFEEVNEDLGLSFSYTWANSNQFGIVKRSIIQNLLPDKTNIRILDGVQNLLPHGVTQAPQRELSTLLDAYKKNELEPQTGLGLYSLSSILVDKPEPSEALKATTAWSIGLKGADRLLSSVQLPAFRRGESLHQEVDIRAERGAYFLHHTLTLEGKETMDWYTVIEGDQGHSDVVSIQSQLRQPRRLLNQLKKDIEKGTSNLVKIVANSDGLQVTNDRLSTTRHFANTLFNVMRGGIFDDQYILEGPRLAAFIHQTNSVVGAAHQSFLENLPAKLNRSSLFESIEKQQDPQLLRLCYEYLPLTFSRRHGDPSRPWNYFSIETQAEDGTRILGFQGNWRDIFQNWEALALSYPDFAESMICKFVNASTGDGYNPYRITHEGIDWEIQDLDDPWSFIGYWGDHQIIYLLKLLEISQQYHPEQLTTLLSQEIFAYANVPYRIKAYEELLADPRDTILYDQKAEAEIAKRVEQLGSDGKLLIGSNGQVYLVNLVEKLLASALAKFSNFVPEAGIWLNTQRPEWNDANNALVGYGVSMVTLYYLRRFQHFFQELMTQSSEEHFLLSVELAQFLSAITDVFAANQSLLPGPLSDQDRKGITDALGEAGSVYRDQLYTGGFSGEKQKVNKEHIQQFISLSLDYIDSSIELNEREDHLYHAYNLIRLSDKSAISVRYLYEMLEGQVAVLSSNYLSPQQALEVLDALRTSALYREDQYSYLLYPDRQLALFLEKNQIPASRVRESKLLQRLLKDGNRQLIEQDVKEGFHFNGSFRNAASMEPVFDLLVEQGYGELVAQEKELVSDIFEEIFDHESFTGRSGTFYGYEGLGSIYWHMVSKLLLAVAEVYFLAKEQGESEEICGKLVEHYYTIRAGIGHNKSPEVYGAFPTDPYSHTPGNAGAQQPGMTGQVKEDILTRMMELGAIVREGRLLFHPILLRSEEFSTKPISFSYYDVHGSHEQLDIPKKCLAFTYCQVPIVYHESEAVRIELTLKTGKTRTIEGLSLDKATSKHLFNRNQEVTRIDVWLKGL